MPDQMGSIVSLAAPTMEDGDTPAIGIIQPILHFALAMERTAVQMIAERLLAKGITHPTPEQSKEETLRLTITEVKEYMDSQARKAALNNNEPGPRP